MHGSPILLTTSLINKSSSEEMPGPRSPCTLHGWVGILATFGNGIHFCNPEEAAGKRRGRRTAIAVPPDTFERVSNTNRLDSAQGKRPNQGSGHSDRNGTHQVALDRVGPNWTPIDLDWQ